MTFGRVYIILFSHKGWGSVILRTPYLELNPKTEKANGLTICQLRINTVISYFLSYQDFNGPPCNLGGNGQSLEERRLFRSQTSVDRGHFHINWSDGTRLGWCGNLVTADNFTDFI